MSEYETAGCVIAVAVGAFLMMYALGRNEMQDTPTPTGARTAVGTVLLAVLVVAIALLLMVIAR